MISAKVFGDSFPEPLILKATIVMKVRSKEMDLKEYLPNWDELLKGNRIFIDGKELIDLGQIQLPT